MTLYEIDGAIREVLENGIKFDEETGEILFDDSDLEQLQVDLERKIENIGLFIKNLRSEAEALKAEEVSLKKRRERKERSLEHYSEYLKEYLISNDRPRFETSRVAMNIRKSEAVSIDPLANIPKDYLVEKVELKPDKAKLKKALKAGETFDGIRIVTNNNIIIK